MIAQNLKMVLDVYGVQYQQLGYVSPKVRYNTEIYFCLSICVPLRIFCIDMSLKIIIFVLYNIHKIKRHRFTNKV